MIATDFQNYYNRVRPLFDSLKNRILPTLQLLCEEKKYALSYRIKESKSLYEKIQLQRYQNSDEIEDFFAATIIIPNRSEEPCVREQLNTFFEILVIRDRKTAKKDPQIFRFDSTRIVLTEKINPGQQNQPAVALKFEVQIRTALEHAWAVATHPIEYKGKSVDWKTSRFCSQIKGSLEQIDNLLTCSESAIESIDESPWPEIEVKVAVIAFFEDLRDNPIPSVCYPENPRLFASNVFELAKAISENYRNIDSGWQKIKEKTTTYLLANQFPISISLFQFLIGLLIDDNNIESKIYGNFYISSELETFFPETKKIRKRFEIKN